MVMCFRLSPFVLTLALGVLFEASPAGAFQTGMPTLDWADAAVPSRHKVVLDAHSPLFKSDDFNSPYAGFKLVGHGKIKVQLSSEAAAGLFVPTVQLFDERWKLIEAYAPEACSYESARFLHPDRLALDFVIAPPVRGRPVYLLITTTAADVVGSTAVQHPAKRYSEARGQPVPSIPDPQVPHSLYGTLRVRLTPEGPPTVAPAAVPSEGPAVLPETQAHYLKAIAAAVAARDTAKALRLLDEAETLGVAGARDTFIEASAKP
jgi:maltose operon protein